MHCIVGSLTPVKISWNWAVLHFCTAETSKLSDKMLQNTRVSIPLKIYTNFATNFNIFKELLLSCTSGWPKDTELIVQCSLWPFWTNDPIWPLTPPMLGSHVWLYPRIIVSKSHENPWRRYSHWLGYIRIMCLPLAFGGAFSQILL